jgi:protein SCO1
MTTTPTARTESATPGGRRSGRRPVVIAVIGVVVLFVLAAVIGRGSSPAPKPPSANVGTQLDTALPSNIALLPLTDENGRPTNLAAFQGKIVVLTDFMTSCQEVCPITTAQLNQIDQAVSKAGLAGKVQFVEVTVDPGRDDPARLHAYRSFANLLPNWTLLTGTPQNLATLWQYFGVSYAKAPEQNPPGIDWLTKQPMTYDVTHSDVLLYLDAAGHERFVIEGTPIGTNAPLTAGERSFLNNQGQSNLTDTSGESWTPDQALQPLSWLTKKHLHATS